MATRKTRRTPATPWSQTPEAQPAYQAARAKAQALANADGFDRGIEANDLFKEFSVRLLPRRENRYGAEVLCEKAMCEVLERCQPGHGPLATREPDHTGTVWG